MENRYKNRAKAIELAIKYYGDSAASNPLVFQEVVERFYLYITTGRWNR